LTKERREFLLRGNLKSYGLVIISAIITGILRVFLSYFTYYDLWSFSSFSSISLGFWVFTIAIIVLNSESWYVAGANACLYVFILLSVNNPYMLTRLYLLGDIDMNSLALNILYPSPYILEIAICCGCLGAILYIGAIKKWQGRIMVILPILFILIEAGMMYTAVFTKQMFLFQAIVDTICAVVYIIVFKDLIFRNVKVRKENYEVREAL